EHVVEEGQPRRHLDLLAVAVDDEGDLDIGLGGGPLLGGRAGGGAHARTSWRAVRKASSSAGVPMVTRRQPARRGHEAQLRTSTERSSRPCNTSSPRATSPAEPSA